MKQVWLKLVLVLRRCALRVAILILTPLVCASSALVWRLEDWRARLQTALHNLEAKP